MIPLCGVRAALLARLRGASTPRVNRPRSCAGATPGAPRRSGPSSVRCASVTTATPLPRVLDLPDEQDSEDELEREDGTPVAPAPGSDDDEPETPPKDGSIEDDKGERF